MQHAQDAQLDAQDVFQTRISVQTAQPALHHSNLTLFNKNVSSVLHHVKIALVLLLIVLNAQMESNYILQTDLDLVDHLQIVLTLIVHSALLLMFGILLSVQDACQDILLSWKDVLHASFLAQLARMMWMELGIV